MVSKVLLFTTTIQLPIQTKPVYQVNFARRKPFSTSRRLSLTTAMDPIQYKLGNDPDPLYSPKAGELYFSYGSNMSREKMESRSLTQEAITFQNAWIGHLRDWELCFDLRAVLPSEPAMGSIIPKKGSEVYGLVYEISTEKCWENLLTSEGILDRKKFHSSYNIIEVELEYYDVDTPEIKTKRKVRTLMSNPLFRIKQQLRPYVLPSRRYVDLLLNGATKERMPAHYIKKLKELPVARPWNDGMMKNLMAVSSTMVFFTKRKQLRYLVYGLNYTNFHFYGNYERLARYKTKDLQVRFWMTMYLVGLVIIYGIYFIPSVILMFGTPKGRMFRKAIRRTLRERKEEEAKRTSTAVEANSESTVTSS